jgi:hypothetical protein
MGKVIDPAQVFPENHRKMKISGSKGKNIQHPTIVEISTENPKCSKALGIFSW